MLDLVSVIIPVYNGAAFLREAIASVLAQNDGSLEVIVIDDGSDDESAAVAQSFDRVRLLRQERAGAGAARNSGIAASTGEFLAFLDADDFWLPGKVEQQRQALADDQALEAVFTHVIQFHDTPSQHSESEAVPGFLPGTMLIRRASFKRVGPFLEGLHVQETAEWHLRALEAKLRYRMLPEPFYRRRVHAGNRGILDPNPLGYVQVLKESLDRRRKAER